MTGSSYGFGKLVERPFTEVLADVRDVLKEQGFGIITEIDVQATVKEKLGRDRPPYVILGACNPTFADQVLEADPEMGLFMPCNVVVYEDPAGTRVSAVDPSVMLEMAGDSGLVGVAAEVRRRLLAAVEAV
jgi:uncharacterized protein (DUF302 family)